MRLSLDRFEGDYAICEDDAQKVHEIHKSKLPTNAKPGDIFVLSLEGSLSVDKVQTERRKQKIIGLQRKLFEFNTID